MLQQISMYILKVTCISGLLFLYYHIALRNKKFHYYNRFYLLMTVVLSMILPVLQLQWFTFFSNSSQTIHLYKIIYGGGEEEATMNGNASLSLEQIATYSLVIISILLVAVLFRRIYNIYRLKKKYPLQQLSEFDFVNTDISSAPFSFLKNIFWRNDISLDEETGKQILQHEIIHIKQKHSWDKVFMQLVLCFYWMNPFYYLLRRELYLIHEFIADEKAVKHSDADAFAKMLLTAQFGKFNFLPAQSIFYSSIKRRLIMLTTSKKPQLSYLRRLMVLPLIVSVACLFAFTVKTKTTNNSVPKIKTTKPFVLVVDAGHGGKDYGALGNGLNEKDATLKIAQKIKDLSSEYGVDVVLTRNSDMFMDPKQKSAFANAQNAGAFVSIHTNAETHNKTDSSGIEIYIDKESSHATENATLGSAIMQQFESDFKTPGVLNYRNVGIWVIKNSTIPAALIECGYITNPDDAANLKDDAKIELMAKNILTGVAAYANNSFDKSKLYQLQNAFIKDTLEPPIVLKNINGNKPLYVLDGKTITEDEFKKIDQSTIESVNVLKDKDATGKYGDKGKNGVIEIKSKADANDAVQAKVEAFNEPIYVLDKKIISVGEMKKISPDAIESINVLKDKTAVDKYGVKGKNGVVEITLKKDKTQALPPLPAAPVAAPVPPATAVQ